MTIDEKLGEVSSVIAEKLIKAMSNLSIKGDDLDIYKNDGDLLDRYLGQYRALKQIDPTLERYNSKVKDVMVNVIKQVNSTYTPHGYSDFVKEFVEDKLQMKLKDFGPERIKEIVSIVEDDFADEAFEIFSAYLAECKEGKTKCQNID